MSALFSADFIQGLVIGGICAFVLTAFVLGHLYDRLAAANYARSMEYWADAQVSRAELAMAKRDVENLTEQVDSLIDPLPLAQSQLPRDIQFPVR